MMEGIGNRKTLHTNNKDWAGWGETLEKVDEEQPGHWLYRRE